jgi:hypothetical protein
VLVTLDLVELREITNHCHRLVESDRFVLLYSFFSVRLCYSHRIPSVAVLAHPSACTPSTTPALAR